MGKIASPFKRLIGYLIDWLVASVPAAYFVYSAATSSSIYKGLDQALAGITFVIFWSLIWAFLNAFLTSKVGGTIGKMAVGTKVVNSEGKMISFYQALFRNYIGYMVSGTIAFLGFIRILIDKKDRRAWHDLIADTYVVEAS